MARYKHYGSQYLRQTENRDLYFEELERIKEIIAEFEEDDDVKIVHYDLPTIPKRITRSDIEELQDIDREYIEQFVEWEDADDELPPFNEADAIVDEFRQIYHDIGNKRFSRFMDNWIEHVRDTDEVGSQRVAAMLQNMMDKGFVIERKVRYDLDSCLSFMSEILDEMPGITAAEKIWIMDSFEAKELWDMPD